MLNITPSAHINEKRSSIYIHSIYTYIIIYAHILLTYTCFIINLILTHMYAYILYYLLILILLIYLYIAYSSGDAALLTKTLYLTNALLTSEYTVNDTNLLRGVIIMTLPSCIQCLHFDDREVRL